MHKTAIIYVSVHHGNTEKLLKEVCRGQPIDLFNIACTETFAIFLCWFCIGDICG